MQQAGGLLSPGNRTASTRRGGSTGVGSSRRPQAQSAGLQLPDLYICYAVEGGLVNQHYVHLNAIATAIAVGAKGVVRTPRR